MGRRPRESGIQNTPAVLLGSMEAVARFQSLEVEAVRLPELDQMEQQVAEPLGGRLQQEGEAAERAAVHQEETEPPVYRLEAEAVAVDATCLRRGRVAQAQREGLCSPTR